MKKLITILLPAMKTKRQSAAVFKKTGANSGARLRALQKKAIIVIALIIPLIFIVILILSRFQSG